MHATIDKVTTTTVIRTLRNVPFAASREEWAFALGFAGTVHGLLYATEAREPLQRLRDVLVDRLRMGEDVVPDAAVESAYAAVWNAVERVLPECDART